MGFIHSMKLDWKDLIHFFNPGGLSGLHCLCIKVAFEASRDISKFRSLIHEEHKVDIQYIDINDTSSTYKWIHRCVASSCIQLFNHFNPIEEGRPLNP